MKRSIPLLLTLALPSAAFAQDQTAPQPTLERIFFGADAVEASSAQQAKARPYMGIQLGEGTKGTVMIAGVMDKSGAKDAGLKAGDKIVRVGDRKTASYEELIAAIGDHEVGDQVAVVVERSGKEKLFLVSLGTRPASKAIASQERLPGLELPAPVAVIERSGVNSKKPVWVAGEALHTHDGPEAEHSHGHDGHDVEHDAEEHGADSFHFDVEHGEHKFPEGLEKWFESAEGDSSAKIFYFPGGDGPGSLEGLDIDLSNLKVELGELGVDFEELVEGMPHGLHVVEMDVETDGDFDMGELHDHITQEIHKNIDLDHGSAEVRVRVHGSNFGEHRDVNIHGADLPEVDGFFFKSTKAQKGACESCGCTCGSDAKSGKKSSKVKAQKAKKAQQAKTAKQAKSGNVFWAKPKAAKANITKAKKGLEVAKKQAWLAGKGAKANAEKAAKRAKAAMAKAEKKAASARAKLKRQVAKKKRSSEAKARTAKRSQPERLRRPMPRKQGATDLEAMRAELEAIRAQLEEMRRELSKVGDR